MKNKFVMKSSCKKGQHEWSVSNWQVRNGSKIAHEFYCIHCLLTSDKAEKEVQSRESLSQQPEVSQEQGT